MLFLTVQINRRPCIQKLKLLYSELNYTAVDSVWQKRPTHFSSQSDSQTVKKLNQMSVAWLLKKDVFLAHFKVRNCSNLSASNTFLTK